MKKYLYNMFQPSTRSSSGTKLLRKIFLLTLGLKPFKAFHRFYSWQSCSIYFSVSFKWKCQEVDLLGLKKYLTNLWNVYFIVSHPEEKCVSNKKIEFFISSRVQKNTFVCLMIKRWKKWVELWLESRKESTMRTNMRFGRMEAAHR